MSPLSRRKSTSIRGRGHTHARACWWKDAVESYGCHRRRGRDRPAARGAGVAAGQASLSAIDTAYTQDFNTLASTGQSDVVPLGWAFSEMGMNANTTYTAGTGSNNAGDTYSFGSTGSSERAFGSLLSGSLIPVIGVAFTNNTGATISSLDVAYAGEQWRLGQSGRGADRLDFEYNLSATSLTQASGWVGCQLADFSSPVTVGTVGALDGNASANRTALSGDDHGPLDRAGQTFWLRWADFNVSGSDDGLAHRRLLADASRRPHDLGRRCDRHRGGLRHHDGELCRVARHAGAHRWSHVRHRDLG